MLRHRRRACARSSLRLAARCKSSSASSPSGGQFGATLIRRKLRGHHAAVVPQPRAQQLRPELREALLQQQQQRDLPPPLPLPSIGELGESDARDDGALHTCDATLLGATGHGSSFESRTLMRPR